MNGAAADVEAALAMSDIWRSATVLAIKQIEKRRHREIVTDIIEALRGK